MIGITLLLTASICSGHPHSAGQNNAKQDPATTHDVRTIEGWTVHVDHALIEKDAELCSAALKILQTKLYLITLVMPVDRLAKLRKVPIWLDLNRRRLRGMQYHPSKEWLTNNGHDARLAKAVHIPQAKSFVSLARANTQPWVVMHELAHAYHDRELSFDHPEIKAAYDAAVQSKSYESVLHVTRGETKHYALTDHKEYFAESTEAFFGTNDFYPFVRGELQKHDPRMYDLLAKLWRGK